MKSSLERYADIGGQTFGAWTVIQVVHSSGGGSTPKKWLCRCACGKEREVRGYVLKAGKSLSCGCINKGHTHGMANTRIYKIWEAMHRRCKSPKSNCYERYGGRGITVCPEWDKFENFYADMGEVPEGKQLDRIDNNKGYSATNCRWVTPSENGQNKRNNRNYTLNGQTFCLAEWSRRVGIDRGTLAARLKNNWPIDKALTSPISSF